jgi:hypothetical protein
MNTKKDYEFLRERGKLAEEAENHLEVLIREAKLCLSEAKRSLERYAETGELTFRINDEALELDKFLRTTHRLIDYKIPVLGLRGLLAEPDKRIMSAINNINDLREHLHRIPGARITETPASIKKFLVEEVLVEINK